MATWEPKGNRVPLPLMSPHEVSVPLAAAAIRTQLPERSGPPRTLNVPQAWTMSPGAGASRVERPRVLAAVIGVAQQRGVGEAVGRDEVPPPDLGGIEPDARGEHVHGPLDEVRGLRPAGAAVGHGAHRVGEGDDGLDAT